MFSLPLLEDRARHQKIATRNTAQYLAKSERWSKLKASKPVAKSLCCSSSRLLERHIPFVMLALRTTNRIMEGAERIAITCLFELEVRSALRSANRTGDVVTIRQTPR